MHSPIMSQTNDSFEFYDLGGTPHEDANITGNEPIIENQKHQRDSHHDSKYFTNSLNESEISKTLALSLRERLEDPRYNLRGFMDSLDKNEANIMIQMNKKEDKHEVGNIRRDDKFGNLDLVTSTENQITAENTAA